ncbi:penicillin-binding transpeptidase domain-containing protein [Phycicoccus sp. Soil748]|uniref:penicillin-binding transpeptidase domain-containing protein n=1 Tax=Phycicoccus sp. Soil748 TaxID=1736397 RepID=UPI000A9B0E6E|nr:penicillin-binding transpeptidase domain-containing protein [Phycicoccus sp. Soil748]
MDRRALVGSVAAVVVVAAAAGGGLWWQHSEAAKTSDREAAAAVDAFAAGWAQRSFPKSGARFAGTTAQAVQDSFTKATQGLGSGPVKVEPGTVNRKGDRATSTVAVTWTLPGGVPWSYDVPLTAKPAGSGDAWAVSLPASATAWAPGLGSGATLSASRTWGQRGDLLDRDGQPLMPVGKVYPVQIDPSRATAATVRQLEKVVDEPAGSLVAKLEAATKSGSKAPIAVITYRESDFQQRKAALDGLKGIIYPVREQPLARTRTFGQPLLGSYGPVNAEQVSASKGRYVAGDYAGVSGLQGRYDAELAGTPGVQVTSSAKPDSPLFSKDAVDGKDVQTTLSPDAQTAAESAVARTGSVPSALVAVDVRTGDVLASANSPALGFDRALTGQYPPGSSFKIVSTYALLTGGKVTPTTSVDCPEKFVVDGRSYKNYEGESFGKPDFATDFAHSCNTAFVKLSTDLGDSDLSKAADALGLTGWAKGVGVGNAFAASVPTNNGKTDKASAMIGQGRNLTSPLALATMSASVARGSAIPPALVTEPAPAGADRTPRPLDAGAVKELRALMRQVVTGGTGTVLRDAPGGPVSGKTGTAEFGSANPPETHAWFVGYQGDVAFAALVEKGKSGGTVAAPVVKDFLAALAMK